jgi:branched-chain amino acid transport system substrate-binding protein
VLCAATDFCCYTAFSVEAIVQNCLSRFSFESRSPIPAIKIFGDEMMFYVVLDFLIFIIQNLGNFAVNLLANLIKIPRTRINIIVLFVIAVLLTIISFYLPKIFAQPPNCSLSSKSANYLSTGDTSLITKKIPNEKDREQQIYDNNKDLNENNSYLLAVAIPANAEPQAANAMLAGVADAQTKFNLNQRDKDPTRPTISEKQLKIVVVDDQNNKDNFAKEVACQIAQNHEWRNILGVIGHHSSGASIAALDIYEKAGITMITPTSTSTNLKQRLGNKGFFRTTVTNANFGKILADKIDNLGGKVSVFYEENNNYSEDLKQQFITNLSTIEPNQIDIKNWTNADIETLSLPNNVKTAVIFSSSGDGQKHDIAIKLIKKLKSIRPDDLNLFGGDSLFKGRTLSEGKTDIEGLKLVIPWFRVKDGQIISDYAKKSEATWRGQINWMTASSYDATQAFLAAIAKIEQKSQKVERKSVLDSMPDVELEQKDTSGAGLKFDNGEPKDFDNGKPKDRKSIFVEVVQKEKLPKILQCIFEVCFKPVE